MGVKNTVLAIVLVLALLGLWKWWASGDVFEMPEDTRHEQTEPLQTGQGRGYPAPTALPTLTPTPAADPSGLLPAPSGVPTQTLTIAQISPTAWSTSLTALKTALDNQDSATLASYIKPEGISIPAQRRDGDVGWLTPGDAVATFDGLFTNGSVPRLRGYFRYGCNFLFSTGWVGPAPLPGGSIDDIDLADWIEGSVYVWEVCDGDGTPLITAWAAGDYYHRAIAGHYEGLAELEAEGGAIETYGPVIYTMLSDG